MAAWLQRVRQRTDADGFHVPSEPGWTCANLLRPDDVEAALAISVAAASEEESVAAVGEANRLLTDEYCIVYNLAEVATLFVVNDYVKDSGIGDVFYSVSDLGHAWLNK